MPRTGFLVKQTSTSKMFWSLTVGICVSSLLCMKLSIAIRFIFSLYRTRWSKFISCSFVTFVAVSSVIFRSCSLLSAPRRANKLHDTVGLPVQATRDCRYMGNPMWVYSTIGLVSMTMSTWLRFHAHPIAMYAPEELQAHFCYEKSSLQTTNRPLNCNWTNVKAKKTTNQTANECMHRFVHHTYL